MEVRNFYHSIEKPGYLKYVLYGDTDSLYICIPVRKVDSVERRLQILTETAEEINKAIENFQNNYIFPRLNLSTDSKHNYTNFKTEMLIGSLLFLDAKKSYVYEVLAKEGKIFSRPEIKYTGGQIVKSDIADFTRSFLKELVEDIILAKMPLKKKKELALSLCASFKQEFERHVAEFNLDVIGIPGKWGKKEQIILGMKLYNFLVDSEVFSMGSSGKFVYCHFGNPNLFPPKFDMKKINGIAVPFVFDKTLLRKKFEEYAISVDREAQFDRLLTKTGKKIIQILNEEIDDA